MQTGAMIARAYFSPGSLLRALPYPRFGAQSYPISEGPSFNKAVSVLRDPGAPSRTVLVLLSGGIGHAFHYHTHVAGARFISTPPAGQMLWEGETWFQLGNTRVMTIAHLRETYAKLPRFDVRPGDQIWTLSLRPFPDEVALGKMPPGLTLSRVPSFDEHFQTFVVVTGR
jgi:hypothetical protein